MEIRKMPWLKKVIMAFLAGLIMSCFTFILFEINMFERLELMSYDLRFRLRGTYFPPNKIIIVTIDERDKREFRKNIKDWSRELYAEIIRRLTDDDAAVIALDMDFSMPTSDEADSAFAEALAYSQRVVLGRSQNSAPLEKFSQYCLGEGIFDLQTDKDGVIRSLFLGISQITDQGQQILLRPLGLELAQLIMFPTEAPSVELSHDYLYLNEAKVPLKLFINFYGPPWTFRNYSFSDVVKGRIHKGTFTGKIVIIGNTDPLAHDYFSTPFPTKKREPVKLESMVMEEIDIHRMSGLEIHANILGTIISQKYISRFDTFTILVLLIVTGLLLSFLMAVLAKRPLFLVLFLMCSLFLLFMLGIYLFSHQRVWLDIIPFLFEIVFIFFAVSLTHWRMDVRERNQIRNLFGKYVSPQVAELLVHNPELIAFSGKKTKLTIFFSDIRGFTSMSETMDPQDVSELLNEYFAHMTRILFKYDGTLDKFMGDAIMAFFGNPSPHDDHALRAIRMSLDMMKRIEELNKNFKDKGKRTINIGIGINTGEVTVGNLGSENYFDYTVIGDDVNLACRLESIAKAGQIIISHKTLKEVKNDVEVNTLDPVMVKGKEKPIQIYEVIRLKTEGLSEHSFVC